MTEEAVAPEYITFEDDFSGPHQMSPQPGDDPRFNLRQDFIDLVKDIPAVRGWWRCPFCKLTFERRHACERHMGLDANFPTFCPVLKAEIEARRVSCKFLAVALTPEEYTEAMICAEKRHKRALELGRVGENGQPIASSLASNQRGALGERAYIKWKGLLLITMDHYEADLRKDTRGKKPPDFGTNHDVKTAWKSAELMKLQRDDPLDYIYIAAAADIGDLVVEFRGWVRGYDAKKTEFWGDHYGKKRPFFGFPYSSLQPMSTLPATSYKPDQVAKIIS